MNPLAASLRLERETAATFLDILQQEQAALIRSEIEQLENLARHKAAVTRQLAELASRRDQSLLALGLAADRAGMEVWLANCDADTASTWRDLLQLAEAARRLNQANGEIIAVRLQHAQQALTVLHQAGGGAPLYNPTGQAFAPPAGSRLGWLGQG